MNRMGSVLVLLALVACGGDAADASAAGLGALGAARGPEDGVQTPPKRALIVAIGDYGAAPTNPTTGRALRSYRALSSPNDVPLIRGALEYHGFPAAGIRVLQDEAATKEGILDAFREHLIAPAQPGDVVVFHYSGHGHQIADDGDDDPEPDGYDELLVPYGAPMEYFDGYDGRYHIRDDELGALLDSLRLRIGPTGSVTVFLDACFSGTGTRGPAEAEARGVATPLGPPASVRSGASRGGDDEADVSTGFGEQPTADGAGGGMAPLVFFAAADHREVAWETVGADNRTPVGSLSYAVSQAFTRVGPGDSYRELFFHVQRLMDGKVTNTPQAEGNLDAQIFSNQLTERSAWVRVDSVPQPREVWVAGGSLQGLDEGAEVAFYAVGEGPKGGTQPLAQGSVVESDAVHALVELPAAPAAGVNLRDGSWAYVTKLSYGALRTRVAIDATLPAPLRAELADSLRASSIIDLVEPGRPADVVVTMQDGGVVARAVGDGAILMRQSGRRLLRAAVPEPEAAAAWPTAVRQFARNYFLRRMDLDEPELALDVTLIPADHPAGIKRNDRLCPSSQEGLAALQVAAPQQDLGGGHWRLAPNDEFLIRVRNPAASSGEEKRVAYFSLLDLMPDGQINVLYPAADVATGVKLEPGEEMIVPVCFWAEEPEGLETLKVFATETYQDFRAMLGSAVTRGDRGPLSDLELVLEGTHATSRAGSSAPPAGAAHTSEVLITVARPR